MRQRDKKYIIIRRDAILQKNPPLTFISVRKLKIIIKIFLYA